MELRESLEAKIAELGLKRSKYINYYDIDYGEDIADYLMEFSQCVIVGVDKYAKKTLKYFGVPTNIKAFVHVVTEDLHEVIVYSEDESKIIELTEIANKFYTI